MENREEEVTRLDHWEESCEPGVDVSRRGGGCMTQGKEVGADKHRLLSLSKSLALKGGQENQSASMERRDQSLPDSVPRAVGGLRCLGVRPLSPPGRPRAHVVKRPRVSRGAGSVMVHISPMRKPRQRQVK